MNFLRIFNETWFNKQRISEEFIGNYLCMAFVEANSADMVFSRGDVRPY